MRCRRRSVGPVDSTDEVIARKFAQRGLAALKAAAQSLGSRLAGEIENMAAPIEKYVGASTLPFFDE